jgi:hypothetical protein
LRLLDRLTDPAFRSISLHRISCSFTRHQSDADLRRLPWGPNHGYVTNPPTSAE